MMENIIDLIGKKTNEIGKYFETYNKLFLGELSTEEFFRNPYYREEIQKISQLNPEVALDYLFEYSKDAQMFLGDYLTYILISRLSFIISDSLKFSKSKSETLLDEQITNIKKYNELLLRFCNLLLSTTLVYPNEKNDNWNGYAQKFKKIQVEITKSFISTMSEEEFKQLLHNVTFDGQLKKSINKNPNSQLTGVDLRTQRNTKSFLQARGAVTENFDRAALLNFLYEKKQQIVSDVHYKGVLEEIAKYLFSSAPALIPKNHGLAKEIFVFYYLINHYSAYVFPLLLSQRLYSQIDHFLLDLKTLKNDLAQSSSPIDKEKTLEEFDKHFNDRKFAARPPDFMIMKGGKLFGLEVGEGKEAQSAYFSTTCGVPTLPVDVRYGNLGYMFGKKCDRCHRPFILCDKNIEKELADNEEEKFENIFSKDLFCHKICGEEQAKQCRYAIVDGFEIEIDGKNENGSFHYVCLNETEKRRVNIQKVQPTYFEIMNLKNLNIFFDQLEK